MRNKIIDATCEINKAVIAMGGEIVENLIQPKDRNKPNADYVFRSENIVAELKTLELDQTSSPSIRSKASAIYQQAIDELGISWPPGKSGDVVTVKTDHLPEKYQIALARCFIGPIQGAIQKANKQIKASKEHFGMPDAFGLLILINTNNKALNFHHVLHLIARSIGTDFKSINNVFAGSINLPMIDKKTGLIVEGAFGNVTRDEYGLKKIDQQFMNNFQIILSRQLEEIRGIPTIRLSRDNGTLSELQNIK